MRILPAATTALTLLAVLGASGQEVANSPIHPLQPPDTTSPRATLQTFLGELDRAVALYRAEDPSSREVFLTATRCLDLSQVPPRFVEATSNDATLLLKEVLDRIELPPRAAIPGRDAVAAEALTRWTVPHTEIELVLIQDGPRAGEFLFSPATVGRSREFFERVRQLAYRPGKQGALYDELRFGAKTRAFADLVAGLPAWTRAEAGGQLVWQWCMLALLALLALLLAAAAILLGRRLARTWGSAWSWVGAFLGPAMLISLQWIIPPLAPWRFQLGGPGVRAAGAVLLLAAFAGSVWLAAAFFRQLARLTIWAAGFERPLNQQLVWTGARVLTLTAVAVIAFRAGQSLGIPISALVTGLGVGGLAVALAAKTTLENVIGGINLFADQPVRIGEVCRFGGEQGTVEGIGLRSTRVRTLGRTVVSIPNSEFATMTLENLSRRDRNLLQTRLRIALDTGPAQVESLLQALRETFAADERVAEVPFRVRLIDLGPDALEIEVFLYVLDSDWNEYLAVREKLLLAAMRVIDDAGLRLVAPTRRHEVMEQPLNPA